MNCNFHAFPSNHLIHYVHVYSIVHMYLCVCACGGTVVSMATISEKAFLEVTCPFHMKFTYRDNART